MRYEKHHTYKQTLLQQSNCNQTAPQHDKNCRSNLATNLQQYITDEELAPNHQKCTQSHTTSQVTDNCIYTINITLCMKQY